MKLFVLIEEILEEPAAGQNSLFVEPAAAAAEVNDVAMMGN